MFIINFCLSMFRASLCPSSDDKDRVTAFGVFWFCWMWLVAVVGRCVAGCEHCEGFCSTCRDRNQKTPPTRAICPAHLIFLRGPFLAPRHIIIHFAAFFRLKYRRPYRPIYDLTPDTGNLLLVSAAAVDTALSVT